MQAQPPDSSLFIRVRYIAPLASTSARGVSRARRKSFFPSARIMIGCMHPYVYRVCYISSVLVYSPREPSLMPIRPFPRVTSASVTFTPCAETQHHHHHHYATQTRTAHNTRHGSVLKLNVLFGAQQWYFAHLRFDENMIVHTCTIKIYKLNIITALSVQTQQMNRKKKSACVLDRKHHTALMHSLTMLEQVGFLSKARRAFLA